MPSPEVERVRAKYRKTPGPLLELPLELTERDFGDLTRAADAFSGVEELRIRSYDADWISAGLTAFARRLKKLSRLDLSASHDLSDAGVAALARNLTNLQALYLSSCTQITDTGVKALAQCLTNLRTLDLSNCNQITDTGVKALAHGLTNLHALNLYGCGQITDAGATALARGLTNLHALDLYGCGQITDAGATALAHGLTNLHTLYLSGCGKITDAGVAELARNLTNLHTLYLRNCNQITDAGVAELARNLTNLRTLDLRNCKQITALPESINRSHKLERLELSGTSLRTLPASLRELPHLRHLDVADISWLDLPDELTRHPETPQAILDYCSRTATEGKRMLNEAKLILVGNEAVGKTSLVNFLVRGEPCRDTPKTSGVAILEGVDVTNWKMDRDATGNAPLSLNVWDFGGQQVLYETHRFFLTARSLYLVVLSARKENETEQEAHLIAWLRSIRTRTLEDVPVIVVINKYEGNQNLQTDEKRLRREFPVIKRFVRTSCRAEFKGQGIDELRRAVVEVIQAELPHVRDPFPRSYFNVKEELAKTARRASILNTNKYRDKCRAQGITDRLEQENLLELLDRIGVVVKYDDTTLLDPNWLTTAVYRILTHAAVVAAGGEFSVGELGALLAGLPPKDYPPERWPFIAEMMERFGLSFRLPAARDRYLVPNQVPVTEPNLPGWDAPGLLRFRYEYQDAPARGLLPRFVVFAHRHLTTPRIAWLNGVVLGIEGCEVLVRMEPHKRRLWVTVRGPEAPRRSALAIARHHFAAVHDLNNLAPGKDVFAQVPVEIPGQPDAAFDFEFLETCERTKVPRVPCPGTNVLFTVRDLLTGVRPEPEPGDGRGNVFNIQNAQFNTGPSTHPPHQENHMGDEIKTTGSGSIQFNKAKVINQPHQTNTHQEGTPNGELKELLEKVLAQLAAEKLSPDDHADAKETVEKIEEELAKPAPSKDRVDRLVSTIERISAVAGGVLRAAGSIAALLR
ncbi:small gtp-binding protein : Leucine-rich-repeat protein OS=Acaryochloris marina (strain MBIC 11017) GN=AM1_1973 PE=4 SV=1: LRR_4: LRR_6: LRR_6: LRR_6: LRR_6: LRR_8: Miro [Gemmata massiliana]|uniref:non-specific serine/threonine protein kinase n=1 Tax=Gemmata massiliana TaxID=1210884 RepID=A0A6P2CXR1_9BACT|nr:leucine-rich repeat domain-containing protein [Gemmata massiliana]VTR93317.1 small gtp-binding protein : Leucine-rich-repeat protein OS=Acaryochloris marina (strain MBIC 11017) GN=AM1_1973 PE=4 SV=1: LRR_4: LRR_6: LRR_6: LRR_6: LRR_6: LRR_8: Miro [Gemmata massiliana]